MRLSEPVPPAEISTQDAYLQQAAIRRRVGLCLLTRLLVGTGANLVAGMVVAAVAAVVA